LARREGEGRDFRTVEETNTEHSDCAQRSEESQGVARKEKGGKQCVTGGESEQKDERKQAQLSQCPLPPLGNAASARGGKENGVPPLLKCYACWRLIRNPSKRGRQAAMRRWAACSRGQENG